MAAGTGFEPVHNLINSQVPYLLGYPAIIVARYGGRAPPDLAADFFLRCRNYPRQQGIAFNVAKMPELFRPRFGCTIQPARPEPSRPRHLIQPICNDVIRHISARILAFSRLI